MTESALQNLAQDPLSVDTTISGHRNQLGGKAHWVETQIMNRLKTSMTRFEAVVHCEVAICVATLSNRLCAIKAARSDVAHLAKLKSRNEISEGGIDNSNGTGAGWISVGGFCS